MRRMLGVAGGLLICAGCSMRMPATEHGAAMPAGLAPGTTTLATVPPAAVTPAAPAAEAVDVPAVVRDLRPSDDMERLLSYFERLRRAQGAELAREHETARLAYGRTSSDYSRIGYAMTLALPGTAFNDDARALELLNPLLKKSEQGLRPLAVLLSTFIQERRRLGGDLAVVQQKLAALKSLERALIEREQNNPGRKP